jgi:hypothetical protein
MGAPMNCHTMQHSTPCQHHRLFCTVAPTAPGTRHASASHAASARVQSLRRRPRRRRSSRRTRQWTSARRSQRQAQTAVATTARARAAAAAPRARAQRRSASSWRAAAIAAARRGALVRRRSLEAARQLLAPRGLHQACLASMRPSRATRRGGSAALRSRSALAAQGRRSNDGTTGGVDGLAHLQSGAHCQHKPEMLYTSYTCLSLSLDTICDGCHTPPAYLIL